VPPIQEIDLMRSIREKYFADIQEAAAGTLIPPEFLAALVANETGGDPSKKRFEKTVLLELWEVIQGRAPKFGSISGADLLRAVTWIPTTAASQGAIVMVSMRSLDALATSWGLTQIMGYQSIPLGFQVEDLHNPAECLHHTQRILMDFVSEFKFNPKTDAEKLFDCWNTGRPTGKPFDPNYVADGVARMEIYRDLPPQAISA
jgi:hypothetical protein